MELFVAFLLVRRVCGSARQRIDVVEKTRDVVEVSVVTDGDRWRMLA